jgi:hypothetical protein
MSTPVLFLNLFEKSVSKRCFSVLVTSSGRGLTCEIMFIKLEPIPLVQTCPSRYFYFVKEVFVMKHLIALLTACFLFAALMVNSPLAFADQAESGSETKSEPVKPRGVAQRLLSFYRDNISAVDSNRCPSHPTCSSYSAEAFMKHGFVMGWLMTVDRLIHEGREEAAVSPQVRSDGRWKIYDPVENNDFWWHRPERRVHEKD